jgi:hypothetical protein
VFIPNRRTYPLDLHLDDPYSLTMVSRASLVCGSSWDRKKRNEKKSTDPCESAKKPNPNPTLIYHRRRLLMPRGKPPLAGTPPAHGKRTAPPLRRHAGRRSSRQQNRNPNPTWVKERIRWGGREDPYLSSSPETCRRRPSSWRWRADRQIQPRGHADARSRA